MIKKILFFIIGILTLTASAVSAKEIWVSVGSNGNGTAESPYGTIQEAADMAQPGDTVMIRPGVYFEEVKFTGAGTKEKPIIFRASEFGKNKVVITRADKDIREKKTKWTLEDAERNIYSVPLDHMPMRILYNGANLMRYAKYEYLKELRDVGVTVNSSNAGISYSDQPTMKDGFYWDEAAKKLFVRLRADEKYGSTDPNKNLMCVSPEAISHRVDENGNDIWASFNSMIVKDSYCFGIVGEKPAYTVLYGLTFETPGFTGVHVRGSDVVVSNCWFEGCANGVHGGQEHQLDNYVSDRVTVEYSEWGAWPYAEDIYELMAEGNCPEIGWTWQGKNVHYSNNCYEVGSLVGQAGENWIIRNNYVHDTLDALSFYAWDQTHQKTGGRTQGFDTQSGEIYENYFVNLLDNAIEFESHASGLDVHHNEFVNTLSPFSIQPLGGPPWPTNIKFHHNVMYQTPEHLKLYYNNGVFRDNENPQYNNKFNLNRNGLFKIGISAPDNWNFPWSDDEMLYPGFVRPAKTINFADKGVQIYNNILYSPDTLLIGYSGRIGGDRGEKSNLKFSNNIISCLVTSPDYANGSGTYNWDYGDLIGRTVSGRNTVGAEFESNMFIPTNGQTMKEDAFALDKGGILCESCEDAGIPGLTERKYEISENSPAIGAGTEILGEEYQTTTIGPLAAGEKWDLKYSAYAYGDINCDGKVDAEDVFAVISSRGKIKGDDGYISRADLDFNGVIDDTDVQIITNEYAKYIQ